MASLVLTAAGSAIGNAILPGIGGALLGGIGGYIGGQIDNALFGSGAAGGARLDNLKIQDSTYGKSIPIIYGNVRVAGNIIWASDLIETLSNDAASGKGGSSSTSATHATYAVDCAIAMGMNETTIRTIWADSKIIYENGAWKSSVVMDAEFYTGTNTQNPSPLMESYLGAGNVPSYRGLSYIVLHRLQLAHFGNRIPNLTFEVFPANTPLAPNFLGEINPALLSRPSSVANNNALPAITLSSSGSRAAVMVVGGFTQSGTSFQFTAVEVDVSGNAPVEVMRVSSAAVTRVGDVSDISWALSPDGTRIVFYMQHFEAGNPITFAIYTLATRSFGSVLSDNAALPASQYQITWLDEQRFVLPDVVAGECGARIYAASGITPVALGFFGVWGAGSSATRGVLPFANYVSLSGGLMAFAVDNVSAPNVLYARTMQWQNHGLVIGNEMIVSTGMGGFVASKSVLIAMGESEFILARYVGSTDVRMMSFIATFNGVSVTRNWTSLNILANGDISLSIKDGRLYFIHEPYSSSLYAYGEIAITPSSFNVSVASTWLSGSYGGTKNYFSFYGIDASRFLLIASGGSGIVTRIAIIERVRGEQQLDGIVGDILLRAGYDAGDIDVAALGDAFVQGYVIDTVASARNALEPLQLYQAFDLIEIDGQLKARIHSAAVDATVPICEARAANEQQDPPPLMTITRAQELDLPRELSVDHLNPAYDFQRGSQHARRITSKSHAVEKIALPIVCPSQNAKQIAERLLYRRWIERNKIEIMISRTMIDVDVGDVINFDGRVLRVTEINQHGGLIKANTVPVSEFTLSSSASADSGAGQRRHALTLIPSTLYMMDIPPLRSADDQAGVYVAISGATGWAGGALFRSEDGVNFTSQTNVSVPVTAGLATSILGPAPTEYIDRAHTVNVALLRGTLSSCTQDDMLNGVNAALLGDELIHFQNANLNGDGSYTLSNILRGRKGSEAAVATHTVGERFVLLQANTLRFIPLNVSDRGRSFYYRAATTGQDVQNVANTLFVPQLNALKPLAPTHIMATRNSGGDMTLNWKRRARFNSEWVDFIDIPMDETAELYDVDVMNGSFVVRRFLNQIIPTLIYTAAQQITDFGTVQSSVTWNIYQLSTRYGRGAVATQIV
jgi:Putative phage tail protein